jgi:hypothetical protein
MPKHGDIHAADQHQTGYQQQKQLPEVATQHDE